MMGWGNSCAPMGVSLIARASSCRYINIRNQPKNGFFGACGGSAAAHPQVRFTAGFWE